MPQFVTTSNSSVLTARDLSALAALSRGGGTVTGQQVALLARVLRGARDWYGETPSGTTGLCRADRSREKRAHRRVRRFIPLAPAELNARTLDGIRDPRELLDDHGVLVGAAAAALAQGRRVAAGREEPARAGKPGHSATLLRLPGSRRSHLPGAA